MAVTPFKSSDNFNMAGFNEKITEADNTYVAKTGDSMSGALNMGNNKITDVASPVADGDAATKGYVDGKSGSLLAGATKIVTLTDRTEKEINFNFDGVYQVIVILNGTIGFGKSGYERIKLMNSTGYEVGRIKLFLAPENATVTFSNLVLIYSVVVSDTSGHKLLNTSISISEPDYLGDVNSTIATKAVAYLNSLSGTIDIYAKYYN